MSRRTGVAAAVSTVVLGLATIVWTWWPRFALGWSGIATTGDGWNIVHPARYVGSGAYPFLYTPYALKDARWPYPPGVPLLFAPVVWLMDRLELVASEPPILLPEPSAWWVLAPALVLTGAVLGPVAAVLVRRLGGRFELSVSALLAPAGGFAAAVVYGHPEDVLALAALVGALGAVLDRRWRRAGVLVGLALLCKQWAVVLLPLVLAAAPGSERRRLLVTAVAVPGVPIAICLLADPGGTVAALTGAMTSPDRGHRFPWTPTEQFAAAPLRVAGLLVVFALAWWLGRRLDGLALVAGAGLVLAARLAFEPVLFAYYLLQWSVVVLVVAAVVTSRGYLWAHALCLAALCLWFAQHPSPWLWWPGAVALAAPGLVLLLRTVRRGPSGTQGASAADERLVAPATVRS